MRIGRNDACPCGSGKKFKVCCEGKNTRGMSRGLVALLAAIAVIGAVGVVAAIRDKDEPAPTAPVRGAAPARNTPGPQPPGPVPPGKVWSAEHGHWHDQAPAAGGAAANNPIQVSPMVKAPIAAQPAPKPQPPGPAPAGKVWSPEHGHWHDARTP